MDAKLKSKTRFKKSLFLSRFGRVCLQSFKKVLEVLKGPQIKNNQYAQFNSDSESVKKVSTKIK
jgi:hypothetical protein